MKKITLALVAMFAVSAVAVANDTTTTTPAEGTATTTETHADKKMESKGKKPAAKKHAEKTEATHE
jgi:hypothetical protein